MAVVYHYDFSNLPNTHIHLSWKWGSYPDCSITLHMDQLNFTLPLKPRTKSFEGFTFKEEMGTLFEITGQTYVFSGLDTDIGTFELTILDDSNTNQLIFVLGIRKDPGKISKLFSKKEAKHMDIMVCYANKDTYSEFFNTLISIGRAQNRLNPWPLPTKIIPRNAIDAYTSKPITNGARMIDFGDEYANGRYYTQETFDIHMFAPSYRIFKPGTREEVDFVMPYIASIEGSRTNVAAPAAGGRRRRKTQKNRGKKTA